jgi:Fe-S cluster biogenesis protein NfuA
MADPGRLDDTAVARRLARIDDLLERVEGAPGPSAQAALDAVRALTEVYGEALARVLDRAAPPLAEAMADDELLGHLMVLHEIHPEPLQKRVARAVQGLRPAVQASGGDVELVGIEGSVARVRLTSSGSGCGSGCGSGSGGAAQAIRETVLAVAPELSEVEQVPDPVRPAAFVPLTALTHRPAPPGGPAPEPARAGS